MPNTCPSWATALRARRGVAGLTQAELGERVGVGQTAVSQWERGDASPRHKLWDALADAFGCSVAQLFEVPTVEPAGADA